MFVNNLYPNRTKGGLFALFYEETNLRKKCLIIIFLPISIFQPFGTDHSKKGKNKLNIPVRKKSVYRVFRAQKYAEVVRRHTVNISFLSLSEDLVKVNPEVQHCRAKYHFKPADHYI